MRDHKKGKKEPEIWQYQKAESERWNFSAEKILHWAQ